MSETDNLKKIQNVVKEITSVIDQAQPTPKEAARAFAAVIGVIIDNLDRQRDGEGARFFQLITHATLQGAWHARGERLKNAVPEKDGSEATKGAKATQAQNAGGPSRGGKSGVPVRGRR